MGEFLLEPRISLCMQKDPQRRLTTTEAMIEEQGERDPSINVLLSSQQTISPPPWNIDVTMVCFPQLGTVGFSVPRRCSDRQEFDGGSASCAPFLTFPIVTYHIL